MLNPDQYVRKAWVDTLENVTGLPVYDNGVPKDLLVLPEQYITLHSQTKQPLSNAKGCYEWLATIVVDVISVNEKGYSHTLEVNQIEEDILNGVEGIQVPNFIVKFTNLVNSQPLNVETPTQTINRQVLNFEHWLNKA